jgi:hypothetical protein
MPLLAAPELQFCDQNGHPYAGGTLDTWIVGTTTLKQTWTNPALTILNTNPVVLDSAGRCLLYGDGAYRIRLKDSLGNVIYDQPTDSLVSLAMVPVVSAATLAAARAVLGVDAAVAAEAAARLAVDTALQAQRDADVIFFNAADATELARATAAEGVLAGEINTERTRAMAAEAALSAAAASNYAEVYTTGTQTSSCTLNNIGGNPVQVSWQGNPGSINNFGSGGTDIWFASGHVKRDGVEIMRVGYLNTGLSVPPFPPVLDTPGAGSHVYSVDYFVDPQIAASSGSSTWSDYNQPDAHVWAYLLVRSM